METTTNGIRPDFQTLQCGLGWFPEQAGGLDRVFFHLVQSLPTVGVGVKGLVVGSAQVGPASRQQVEAFAPAEAPLPVRWWQARQAAGRLLRPGAFDLVAAHFALYTFPFVGRIPPRPLVVHFHGPWAAESQAEGAGGFSVRFKRFIEQSVYRRATRFIVLSEAFRDVLHRQYRVPPERIRIVPGGVAVAAYDLGVSRAEARTRLDWPTDRPVILAVRRLARRMGLENLIDAMHIVRKRVPEALLMIAGRGPLQEELRDRIHALDLEHQVQLLGFVPDADLPWAYRAADLTIVPTVALEGFGLITIESLAAGTPALVTPVGGLPEVVRGLSDQLILPDASVPELADGLLDALAGRRVLPDAGTCQQYARTHFDWSVIAAQTRIVYEEALA
jgi:glycosyltransferase involved in cell wall biosynthesis